MSKGALALAVFMLSTLASAASREYPLDIHALRVLERDSGPVNYYQWLEANGESYIHADYRAPLKTVTLFEPLPDKFRRGVHKLRWRWRALVLPKHGNECARGLGDSAAAVYVTWKKGMRWYSLKFIWSAEAKVGDTCNKTRNPFVFSDSVVLHSGHTSEGWVAEEVDVEEMFQKHFIDTGDTDRIPELQGIGLLSDGDQTQSESSADYAGFEILK
jgi:hypothetical protein